MALDVLVVDDEADIRELVSGVLEDEGYSVRSAADSTAALDAIEERRPSLLMVLVWFMV
jgi:two-component system nitrogen regulation response regulator NtrX